MRLYLAGPMSGIQDFNYHAFKEAAGKLEDAGHTVFNPADNDVANGFDPRGFSGDPTEAKLAGFSLRTALKEDLAWICDNAEGIALLPGWETSKGVAAEVALAKALGIQTRPWGYWQNLDVPEETVEFKPGVGFVIEEVPASA